MTVVLRLLKTAQFLFLFVSYTGFAQLQLTFPTSRLVLQRNNNNQANVPVAGQCPANATQVRAQLTVRQGGLSTGWIVLDNAPSSGSFQGTFTGVTGGWYDLEVKAYAGATELASLTTPRIGVGEVFITSGQSNSWGVNCYSGQASDDRVSIINYWTGQAGQFSESSLPFVVSHADLATGITNTGMFPGAYLYVWGALGERLVSQLGVPVMFYGASYSGTNSKHWVHSANGEESFQNLSQNMPYRLLGATIQHYLKRTGVRAVLWHQGEGDNYYQSRDDYLTNIGTVINKSRAQLGFGNLSWVVSRVSYIPAALGSEYANHETDQNIIDAQNILAGQPNNWTGPATDGMIYPNYRRADYFHLHFDADDCPALTDVWTQALPPTYFTSTQPSLPDRTVLLTTGYVFPFTTSAGQSVQVPYFSRVPVRADNQYTVDMLTETGCYLGTLTAGTANPLSVTLPSWANGRYRFRVNSTSPATTGEPNEPITVNGSGSGLPPNLPALVLSTVQNGNWDNPQVWSCGRIPTVADTTELRHVITIPAGVQAQTGFLYYKNGAQLIYQSGGSLRIK
ncbi:sialate O-acetylesterase [Spirosoma agri]|uniref:Sialate O-acetylesterase n=1 Tax=Spirosoma agri TaxID=1987381 RepID=A0A6M0IM64_9BACT|nr:sialate O-acetylesterase [Spirosoma agri]NEU69396.1 sialate O-acetylesterase [Spirosoma agri]